jgi:uncharacterized membrane protein YkvA (DUF1232 family)
MPTPPDGEANEGSSVTEYPLAAVLHPLDTAAPVPVRTKQEILKEGLLLVPHLAKLLFRLLRDNRVPAKRRLAMTIAAAYIAFPIDIVPDAIPFLGTVGDLLVLAFAIDHLLQVSPPEVVEELWDGSEEGLELVRGIAGWGVELIPNRLLHLASPRSQ